MNSSLWPIVMFAIFLLLISIITIIPLIMPDNKKNGMCENVIYNDRYVEIYPDYMILNGYYYGVYGRKKIDFASVKNIALVRLNFLSGKYRLQGTGDFKTWFTYDTHRPSKETVFIVYRNNEWWNVAFSAENIDKVYELFKSINLTH